MEFDIQAKHSSRMYVTSRMYITCVMCVKCICNKETSTNIKYFAGSKFFPLRVAPIFEAILRRIFQDF